MNDLSFYFDEVKKALDLKTDSMLARRLEISRQSLYQARKTGRIGVTVLDEISGILGIEKEHLLVAQLATKKPENSEAWGRISNALSSGTNAGFLYYRKFLFRVLQQRVCLSG